MLSIVKSIGLQGLNGYLISIEVDISTGIPCFEIVGLPDASVKEAKERVKIAIKNTGVEFLSRKITVNLAPANTRKEGSKFDLSIAVGILIASGVIENPSLSEFIEESIFVGELSLNGSVGKVNGILPICIEARKLGIKRIILPKENAEEASLLDGLEILPICSLKEIIEYLNGENYIEKQKNKKFRLDNRNNYQFDFSEVKGQEHVKRALEISAAGGHNCLLIRCPWFRKNNVSQKDAKYFTRYYFRRSLRSY